MNGYAKTTFSVAAVLALLILVASGESAQAYDDALAACSKWTGEGAGLQYKCFECMKRVDEGSSAHWVNTCPEYDSDEGWNWFPFADQEKRRR